MTEKEKRILKITNNVLYFGDNSDYATALWQIFKVLKPEILVDDELDFIDD